MSKFLVLYTHIFPEINYLFAERSLPEDQNVSQESAFDSSSAFINQAPLLVPIGATTLLLLAIF
jgi:hypothetical protein